MVFVKYFIPEDGDDQAHPNVFKVSGCASVKTLTLGELKEAFPVSGKYHFRFLQQLGGTKMTVWMDAIDESELVPYGDEGQVFAKVSRIGVQHYNTAHPQSSSSSSSPPSSSSSPTAANQRRESFGAPGNLAERTTSTDSNSGGGAGGGRRNSERLISFEADSPSKSPFHASDAAQMGAGSVASGGSGGGDEGLLDFGPSDGADFAADFSGVSVDVQATTAGSNASSTSDLFSLDAGSLSQTPVSANPSPINGQMGVFASNNPMGGAQQANGFAVNNGMQQGRGPMQNNANPIGMGGLGALPHPSQLANNSGQNNLMSKGRKPDSFSDLGSLTLGKR